MHVCGTVFTDEFVKHKVMYIGQDGKIRFYLGGAFVSSTNNIRKLNCYTLLEGESLCEIKQQVIKLIDELAERCKINS